MTVFVYAQVIYLTYGTSFDPKNPTDDLPKFVLGWCTSCRSAASP